jgi:hypothetical protein
MIMKNKLSQIICFFLININKMSFFANMFNSARNYFGSLYKQGKDIYNNYIEKPKGDENIPAAVRRFLNKHGTEQITSLRVARTPISSALSGLLNIVSFGGFERGKQKQNIDDFFHLFFVINDKYIIEKNQLVKIANYKYNDREESMTIPSKDITINELLDKGSVGDASTYWGKYQAFGNNCQDWVMRTLLNNNLGNNEIYDFVKQPLDQLLPEVGSHTEKTSNFLTDTGAMLDRGLQDLTGGLLSFKDGGLVKKNKKKYRKKNI